MPSPTDRPDIVGGDQIHVIYVDAGDSPDRFSTVASAITTDLNAINTWWKRQDPTRAPRFDRRRAQLHRVPARSTSATSRASARHGVLQPAADSAARTSAHRPRGRRLRRPAEEVPRLLRPGAGIGRARDAGTPTSARRVAARRVPRVTTSRRTSEGSRGRRARLRQHRGFIRTARRFPGGRGSAMEARQRGSVRTTRQPRPAASLPGRCVPSVRRSNLDVLYPTPAATTIDAAILDFGHRRLLRAHSGTWWDVQGLPVASPPRRARVQAPCQRRRRRGSVGALDQPSVSARPERRARGAGPRAHR